LVNEKLTCRRRPLQLQLLLLKRTFSLKRRNEQGISPVPRFRSLKALKD
jgi:hypothetical protein